MNAGKHFWVGGIILLALLAPPMGASAQSWSWSFETIDPVGKFASAATDDKGNLHVSYISAQEGGELRYALRPAGSSRWFNMTLDKHIPEVFTRIAVDSKGNPHICYTPAVMKYAHWDGKRWYTQEIAPGSGLISHTCSVSVAPDGTPSVTWFQTEHILRYAVRKDGAWMARTLDAEGLVGKWNSMVLDAQGNPRICYSAFYVLGGELRYAEWSGDGWKRKIVDSPKYNVTGSKGNRGMGNAIVLDSQGNARISYFDDDNLKFAQRRGANWAIEVVDQVTPIGDWRDHRSAVVLDRQGNPHISYEGDAGLKHAYYDGTRWNFQIIAPPSGDLAYFNAMTTGPDGTLYIIFRDPKDGALKVAIGLPAPAGQTTKARAEKE